MKEELVARIWEEQQVRAERLVTGNGVSIEVVSPGRRHSDCGPDFRDALIMAGGRKVIKGDVEVHVRSSDWQTHRHHRDPVYNGVILHVVMWDDAGAVTPLQNGGAVPVLALEGCLEGSLAEVRLRALSPGGGSPPCRGATEPWGSDQLGSLLDAAGEARFRQKAENFAAKLAREGAAQALYAGMMEALGYTKNQEPFRELARRLPLEMLARLAPGKSARRQVQVFQALLLGTAGLLPSQRPEQYEAATGFVAEIEHIWRSLGGKAAMTRADWRFFRVRPDNFPPRRIAAASYLLARYLKKGLVAGMLELLERGRSELERGLVVNATGYWADHFDFGAQARKATLLGQGRAAETAVNIILPFFAAWGQTAARPDLEKHAVTLYQSYPRLDDNEVTRRMRGLLGAEGSRVIDSARRQQGLLHLYKTFCQERGCAACPCSGVMASSEL